jgi:cyclic pyranopterin phosphate synthase
MTGAPDPAVEPSASSKPDPTARLVDAFGRRARTLRISVTDRCNFRCSYCMPAEEMTWFPRSGILSFEEIARAVRVLAACGVRRFRLTGGEPTLRRDLPVLASLLRGIPGVERLDMTTNGVALPRVASALREAGLDSITVSLDTLRRDRFEQMTRRDALDAVLRGLDAARDAGFSRLKVNCVTLRGVNDDEAVGFAAFAREHGLAVRFIEFMPLDGGAGWDASKVVPGAEVKAAIHAAFPLVPRDERPEAPARPYAFADGAPGEVGFINPVTEPFCARCDRLRLTADGTIKNCLFDRGEVDVLGLLRGGAGDDEILAAFEGSVAAKGPGGMLQIERPEAYAGLRNMSQVGG